MALQGLINGEDILPIRIHVLEPRWREMSQILFRHRMPLHLELVERGLHVHCILDDHCIGHQVGTHRLIGSGFRLFPANDAFVRQEEKIAQGMQGFPFGELGIDAAPIVFTLQVAEDKERFNQAAIFLQGAGEDVLSGDRPATC
jgi:hypothetical protein